MLHDTMMLDCKFWHCTDTAYMYMIAVLGIVQTYALRHPDINANAHVTYALMAAVIMTAMSGVVRTSCGKFWSISIL